MGKKLGRYAKCNFKRFVGSDTSRVLESRDSYHLSFDKLTKEEDYIS